MLERQRAGPNGAADASIDVWRSHGRELNLRMRFPGLEPNPDDGGRRRWPMLDSFGLTLALLEQDADCFVTSDPATGSEIHRERGGSLLLQGRANPTSHRSPTTSCMTRASGRTRASSARTDVHARMRPTTQSRPTAAPCTCA